MPVSVFLVCPTYTVNGTALSGQTIMSYPDRKCFSVLSNYWKVPATERLLNSCLLFCSNLGEKIKKVCFRSEKTKDMLKVQNLTLLYQTTLSPFLLKIVIKILLIILQSLITHTTLQNLLKNCKNSKAVTIT